jgi:hypothetical protein
MKNVASSPSRVTLAMSPTPEDLDAQIAHRIELDEVMMDGALALERTIDLLPSEQLEVVLRPKKLASSSCQNNRRRLSRSVRWNASWKARMVAAEHAAPSTSLPPPGELGEDEARHVGYVRRLHAGEVVAR